MKLRYSPKSIKQLKKLPVSEKKKVVKKLEILAKDPWAGKLLKGEYEGLRSIQAWPYRIVYQVNQKTIIIYSVAHRHGVYRS